MSEYKRNLMVGTAAIVSTLCLLVMLLLFGWVPRSMDRGYVVQVNMPDAVGLYAGARVWYGGVEVGSVETVGRRDPLRPEVAIKVKVEQDQDLPEQLSAFVYEPLIGGAPRLMLDLKPGATELTRLPRDGTAVIQGRYLSRIGAMMGGEAGDDLDQALMKADEVLASVQGLAGTWRALGDHLVQLTEPRSPESVDTGAAAGNIASLVARADTRMAELKAVLDDTKRVMASVDKLVSDPALQADLQKTLSNAAELTAGLASAMPRLEGKIDGTLTSIDGQVAGALGTLTKEYTEVASQMTRSLEAYQTLAEDIRSGKGTAGKLVQDPALYNNLNDAVERLQTAIETFRATLETWTEDGLPIKL